MLIAEARVETDRPGHLGRFSRREPLTVTWQRTGSDHGVQTQRS